MAGICETAVRKSGGACEHWLMGVRLDGVLESIDFTGPELHALDWDAQLPTEFFGLSPRKVLIILAAKRLRSSGVAFASFVNRVTNGDEATNVKQYDLIGAGADVLKTNIGTAYVDILPGASGQRSLVDCTGCAQFRIVLSASLVATGPFQVRVVKDSDNTVFYESPSLTQTGERELDTDWQSLPGWATGLEIVRVQAKSTTASDDPRFRRCLLLLW